MPAMLLSYFTENYHDQLQWSAVTLLVLTVSIVSFNRIIKNSCTERQRMVQFHVFEPWVLNSNVLIRFRLMNNSVNNNSGGVPTLGCLTFFCFWLLVSGYPFLLITENCFPLFLEMFSALVIKTKFQCMEVISWRKKWGHYQSCDYSFDLITHSNLTFPNSIPWKRKIEIHLENRY